MRLRAKVLSVAVLACLGLAILWPFLLEPTSPRVYRSLPEALSLPRSVHKLLLEDQGLSEVCPNR